MLRRHDYRPGPVDGLFGPRTERAVLRFQRAEALPRDGVVGRRTLRRLRVRAGDQRPASSPKIGARSPDSRDAATAGHARAEHPAGPAGRVDWSAGPVARWTGYSRSAGSLRVREVQRMLRRHDYRPGPVDGLFGPRTERAVLRFQRAEALTRDGIVGRRTLRRLHVRAGGQRSRTSSPKVGARSPDRPTVAPAAPADRTAPAPGAKTQPAPAPEAGGGSAGVVLLVALLALVVLYLLLLAVLAIAHAVERRPAAGGG